MSKTFFAARFETVLFPIILKFHPELSKKKEDDLGEALEYVVHNLPDILREVLSLRLGLSPHPPIPHDVVQIAETLKLDEESVHMYYDFAIKQICEPKNIHIIQVGLSQYKEECYNFLYDEWKKEQTQPKFDLQSIFEDASKKDKNTKDNTKVNEIMQSYGLGDRACKVIRNAWKQSNYTDPYQFLKRLTIKEVSQQKGCGPTTLKEIKEKIINFQNKKE